MSHPLFRCWPGAAVTATLLVLFVPVQVWSAGQAGSLTVGGTVRTPAGAPLAGARVLVAAPPIETMTDARGAFVLRVPSGRITIHVTHPDWLPETLNLAVTGDITELVISVRPLARFDESVTVAAIRAAPEAPVTKQDLDRGEIEHLNVGQEIPFLLEQVPSLTQYSDSGGSSGYAYIYLRGIHQTRMNITLDGVPLNEPEDSAFYFANFGDLANAIGSIQVQRGVGTSTVGAASFVGSVNFASVDFAEEAQGTIRVGGGTFGTRRIGGTFHSGRLGGGLKLYAQAAYQESDGYRRHSGISQRSLYFGLAHDTDASFVKVFGFAGQEQTQLSFLATDEATLAIDPRHNDLTPEERDRFGQRFISAQYHRALGSAAELSVQGYYNGADGWYRIADETADTSGLYEYGLDWRSIGATATYRRTAGAWSLTWGSHVNDFGSHHTRDIVDGAPTYANQGFKNEVNSFLKLGYTSGRWSHYGDVQVRWARFRYEGSLDLGSVDWVFLNPKVGTRVTLGEGVSVYGSVGLAGREPGRMDMLQGEDNASLPYRLDDVRPERVANVETGIDIRRGGFAVGLNGYVMEFRDEIALTGELSDIGLPTRQNVDRSARRGVEIDVRWRPIEPLQLRHTAAYSYNRIRAWTQYYDIYDESGTWMGSTPLTHADVPPLLTPAVTASLSSDYSPVRWATLGLAGRYTGRSNLDNTGSTRFTAPDFFVLDLSADVALGSLFGWSRAEPTVRIRVDNLLNDAQLYPSGYSYQYYTSGGPGVGVPDGVRYFYPLATRSVTVMLDLKL